MSGIFAESSWYPPVNWTFLPDDVPAVSSHELWSEMTARYVEHIKNKHLVNNAYLMDVVQSYQEDRDYVQRSAMKPIVEADEDDFSVKQRDAELSDEELDQQAFVVAKISEYSRLLATHDIETSYQKRLSSILDIFKRFRLDLSPHNCTAFDSIVTLDKEVEVAIARTEKRLDTDASDLKAFLARLMYEEWVAPETYFTDSSNQIWKQYGIYLGLQKQSKEQQSLGLHRLAGKVGCGEDELEQVFGNRLEKMIRRAGLDKGYVKRQLEKYATRELTGRWPRLAGECRWYDLAAKLRRDRDMLDELMDGEASLQNPSGDSSNLSRKSQVLVNMRLAKAAYFKNLNNAKDFQLSKKALKLDKEKKASELKAESKAQKKILESKPCAYATAPSSPLFTAKHKHFPWTLDRRHTVPK